MWSLSASKTSPRGTSPSSSKERKRSTAIISDDTSRCLWSREHANLSLRSIPQTQASIVFRLVEARMLTPSRDQRETTQRPGGGARVEAPLYPSRTRPARGRRTLAASWSCDLGCCGWGPRACHRRADGPQGHSDASPLHPGGLLVP